MNKAAPRTTFPITFFPDYRSTNPYQTLHYESLTPLFHAEPGTIKDAIAAQSVSSGSAHLFHLHWEHAVFAGTGDPRAVDDFLDDVERFRALGGRVIWTVHNLAPHEETKRRANADLQLGLCKLADIVHLHSLPALAAAKLELPLQSRRVRVIAHPNFEGAYPVYPREIARKELGLPEDGRIVLCPGRIAAYKQPVELVAAFLAHAGANDRLILAGETARGFVFEVPCDARIIHRPGFETPEDVGRLHAAADFIALPYRVSLTSGSAILAATLGRAVLGTDTPGLRDAVGPPKTGHLYPPGALNDAMREALQEPVEIWAERGLAAAAEAGARDRAVIAAGWLDVLTLLARPPFQRTGD
ncbi:glycosyltransferase family 4 protein [Rhodobacterales bacterium]|nr:glycosyltransferase family 4 protein [Rhodobacterales bacterium]